MEKSDLTQEDIESLKTVANSDLPASWIAESLCESFNIDTSQQTTTEPEKTLDASTEPAETQEEGSIFAY
jgi:hypothetical protein